MLQATRRMPVGACHRISDGQEHKIFWRAGPEQETIFHLRVTACREQGRHCRHKRLAYQWVASRGLGTSCSNSFILGANYKIAVPCSSPCALTGGGMMGKCCITQTYRRETWERNFKFTKLDA